MTSVTLTGTYSSGYTLGTTVTNLTIAFGAYVGPSGGVYSGHVATVVNYGRVFNYSTVANSGIGVDMVAGGAVTNGSTSTHRLIYGKISGVSFGVGAGTVTNFGRISGGSDSGVYLKQGGTVTNGSPADTTALISGGKAGIDGNTSLPTTAMVINYGTIAGASKFGVYFYSGGTVTNGTATDTTALISGYKAVAAKYSVATVVNSGTISGAGYGVYLGSGGTVTNGTSVDTTALIRGYIGVASGYAGSGDTAKITNFGTVQASGEFGISITQNGSAINYGTITSDSKFGRGVMLWSGGSVTVTNGSASDTTALISGYHYGVYARGGPYAAATVTNFGTIQVKGSGSAYHSVEFRSGSDRLIAESGSIFIGSVQGGGGTLELASGTGTIMGIGATGTIAGTEAVTFAGFGTYQLDAGSSWTLSGTNVIDGGEALTDAGIVNQGASLTVGSGSTASSLVISNGGTWTIDGSIGIGLGGTAISTLKVIGTLVKSGAGGTSIIQLSTLDLGVIEAATGKLDFKRTMSGSGALRVDAGATLELDSSARRTLLMVFGGASATLALKAPTKFAATISGFAVSDTIDLLKIIATGARINAKDQLVIVDGTTTVATLKLTGTYTGSIFTIGSDGHGGTDVTLLTAASVPPAAATPNTFVAAMAGLSGGSGSSAVAASPTANEISTRLYSPGAH
jgi:hypothetical protein